MCLTFLNHSFKVHPPNKVAETLIFFVDCVIDLLKGFQSHHVFHVLSLGTVKSDMQIPQTKQQNKAKPNTHDQL